MVITHDFSSVRSRLGAIFRDILRGVLAGMLSLVTLLSLHPAPTSQSHELRDIASFHAVFQREISDAAPRS